MALDGNVMWFLLQAGPVVSEDVPDASPVPPVAPVKSNLSLIEQLQCKIAQLELQNHQVGIVCFIHSFIHSIILFYPSIQSVSQSWFIHLSHFLSIYSLIHSMWLVFAF